MKENKERDFKQLSLNISESMTTAILFSNNQIYLALLAISSFKAFKVIITEEQKYKLVTYLEKWEDLNNLIGKNYKIDGKTLD